jgi:hypothetical protein
MTVQFRWCPKCGTQFAVAGQKFCAVCGFAIPDGAVPAGAPAGADVPPPPAAAPPSASPPAADPGQPAPPAPSAPAAASTDVGMGAATESPAPVPAAPPPVASPVDPAPPPPTAVPMPPAAVAAPPASAAPYPPAAYPPAAYPPQPPAYPGQTPAYPGQPAAYPGQPPAYPGAQPPPPGPWTATTYPPVAAPLAAPPVAGARRSMLPFAIVALVAVVAVVAVAAWFFLSGGGKGSITYAPSTLSCSGQDFTVTIRLPSSVKETDQLDLSIDGRRIPGSGTPPQDGFVKQSDGSWVLAATTTDTDSSECQFGTGTHRLQVLVGSAAVAEGSFTVAP